MLTIESVVIIATLTQGNSAIHLIWNADEEGVTEVKMLSRLKHASFTSWCIYTRIQFSVDIRLG